MEGDGSRRCDVMEVVKRRYENDFKKNSPVPYFRVGTYQYLKMVAVATKNDVC